MASFKFYFWRRRIKFNSRTIENIQKNKVKYNKKKMPYLKSKTKSPLSFFTKNKKYFKYIKGQYKRNRFYILRRLKKRNTWHDRFMGDKKFFYAMKKFKSVADKFLEKNKERRTIIKILNKKRKIYKIIFNFNRKKKLDLKKKLRKLIRKNLIKNSSLSKKNNGRK